MSTKIDGDVHTIEEARGSWMDSVSVKAPYNRLKNIELIPNGDVLAKVEFESNPDFEQGALSSAEIGRHMAILGTYVLAAKKSPVRKFYHLAKTACLKRHPASFDDFEAKEFKIQGRMRQKNSVVVEMFRGREQTPIAELVCGYASLSEGAFCRIFRQEKRESRFNSGSSPYVNPIHWAHRFLSKQSARAGIGPVKPSQCAGHFEDFPALPVAILMEGVNRLACEHFIQQNGHLPRLRVCNVHAEQLAFADTELEFSVEVTDSTYPGIVYQGSAICRDKEKRYVSAEMIFEQPEKKS